MQCVTCDLVYICLLNNINKSPFGSSHIKTSKDLGQIHIIYEFIINENFRFIFNMSHFTADKDRKLCNLLDYHFLSNKTTNDKTVII